MTHISSVRNSWFLGVLLLLCVFMTACKVAHGSTTTEERYARASEAIAAARGQLIAFRHDLHRHPELSLKEKRTSGKIVEQLNALGFDVRPNVGGHGVVAILQGNGPGASDGPTIAFRADMDAVRDYSDDPAPYASIVEGVRHSCGHDVHSAIGIGLAVGFAEIRDTLPGNIMLIFQPAEEAGTGARAMLADGVFEAIKPDVILAVHTFPLEVGELATLPNALLGGRAQLTVSLKGTGDLAEAAEQVRAALMEVSTIRPEASLEPASADFIYVDLAPQRLGPVNEEMLVTGFVVSAGIERRAFVREQIMQAINAVSLDDVEIDVFYQQALEGVNNDPVIVDKTVKAINALTSDIRLDMNPDILPAFSEDFGSFQKEIPGVMYFLGVNSSEKGTAGFPHSPDYVADDDAISVGAHAMLAASLTLMDDMTGGDQVNEQ